MPRPKRAKRNRQKGVQKATEARKRKYEEKQRKLLKDPEVPPEATFIGRRIFSWKSLLDGIEAVSKHTRKCKKTLKFVNETRVGLASTATFKCSGCGENVSFTSDGGGETCSVNEALQWGCANVPVSLEDASSLFACLDVHLSTGELIKKEIEEVQKEVNRQELLPLNRVQVTGETSRPAEKERTQCPICNKPTGKTGLQLEGVDEDLSVMFVLQKMLLVPEDKLRNLVICGSAQVWMSSCDKCTKTIKNAFDVHKKIDQLELEWTDLRKEVQTSVCMSRKLQDQSKSKVTVSNSICEPVAINVRNFVATGNWIDEDRITESAVIVKHETDLIDEPPPGKDPVENSYNEMDFSAEPWEDTSPPSSPPTNDPPLDKTEKATEAANYRCKLCPQLSPMLAPAFVQHILYHKRRPLKCKICQNFLTGDPLELSSRPAKLSTCPLEALEHRCSPEMLEKVDYETNPIWRCCHCSKSFDLEEARDNHETSCLKSIGSSRPVYTCCVSCDKNYSNLDEWQIHRALQHPEVAQLSCPFCDASFKIPRRGAPGAYFLDRTSLRRHFPTCPGLIAGNQKIQSPYAVIPECDFCGASFKLSSTLQDHLQRCHHVQKEASFSCEICFVRNAKWDKIRVHMNKHREHGAHICDQCGYKVARKNLLVEHYLQAHGVKPENAPTKKCDQDGCPFEAYLNGTLTRHKILSHGAERKHECQFCGKRFLSACHLNGHRQTHTNKLTKPFQCEICGNSFALRNYLYIHMRLSHQNRPFASTNKKKSPRKKHQKPVPSKSVQSVALPTSTE